MIIDGLLIPSQETEHITPRMERVIMTKKLPILLKLWGAVEKWSGHRWKATSFVRKTDAPSHYDGSALDIAPDFTVSSQKQYAGNRRSDPVLYKREPLMRALQSVAQNTINDSDYDIGLFVEPDHIHMGLFIPSGPVRQIRVIKWGVEKPYYPDSLSRMKLPMFN